jgi:predicted Fe-Mo cluster-binding NifX family protein
MKLLITSQGEYMNSQYCGDFEECEYIIIYDTLTKQYASRKSPSFYTKNSDDLINFLKAILIKHIITSKDVPGFKVYKPKNKNATVEEVIMEYLSN